MSDLTTIRDRVEQTLADVSNAIWSTTWLDEAIQRALDDYSLALPVRQISTYDLSGNLSSNKREIDLGNWNNLNEAVDIITVWLPYDTTSARHSPREFEFWRDNQILHILDDPEPAETETARIFYERAAWLSGLAGAVSTTVRAEHYSVLVVGASGYAAFSRGLDLTEQISITQQTAQEVRLWGKQQIKAYQNELQQLARRRVGRRSRVDLPALDKWDKSWS